MSAVVPTSEVGFVLVALRLLRDRLARGNIDDKMRLDLGCEGAPLPTPAEIDAIIARIDREDQGEC